MWSLPENLSADAFEGDVHGTHRVADEERRPGAGGAPQMMERPCGDAAGGRGCRELVCCPQKVVTGINQRCATLCGAPVSPNAVAMQFPIPVASRLICFYFYLFFVLCLKFPDR